MTAKTIGCPVADHGLFDTSDELAAHLTAVHQTTYEIATGSELTQDEADQLGLDGRDGTGVYTLADLNDEQRAQLWARRAGAR
jgi:hypothetical protein